MIQISQLIKNYSEVQALKSISLSINSCSIFAFVGPNGAGKSTTINILTGIVSPTSGIVKILGYDLNKDALEIKKRIGVMPEILSLFDGLTAEEYLIFVGRVYGLGEVECSKRKRDLLEYFELDIAKDRLIATYSQGMRKKLGFASAIIHSPKVLFLDEPFESVDPLSRKKMKETLTIMRNKGTLIIITSHELAEVEDFCDDVAIINKGKLVFQSKTKDIRTKIKNEITQETYQSLEEIFIDVVSDKNDEKPEGKLLWL